MMKRTISYILLIFVAIGCNSTNQVRYNTDSAQLIPYNEKIEESFLRHHLEIIASDQMMGRDTGTEGQKMAAEYLADFYTSIGFEPKGDDGTYFQKFDLIGTVTDSLVYNTYRVSGSDHHLVNKTVEAPGSHGDYTRIFGGASKLEGEIVFAGFGVTDESRGIDHLAGEELEGKWVLVFDEIPHVVNGETLINPEFNNNARISSIVRDHNALGILLIPNLSQNEFEEEAKFNADLVSNPTSMSLAYRERTGRASGASFGVNQISPALAAEILGLENASQLSAKRNELIADIQGFNATNTSYYLDFEPYSDRQNVETENVLAYIEGADEELKDEVLVLMAHYDHVGIDQPDETGDRLHNGADDNGSGTTALLGIAHAINEAQKEGYKPKRSILFLHVTAEELGLLGSRYYSDHPVIPIENTVASFNADMIGRNDPEHEANGETDYVYLIGGEIISSELDSMVVEANNKSVGMTLDRRYNDLTDRNQFYRRSDHWNFGRLSVPFVFFFTGVHADYHRPSDTVDKIDFEKYTRIVRLIYTSSIEVLNYDGRPQVDNQEFIEITNSLPR